MPGSLSGSGLVVELHMHTNVYACGCSLSVTCQVAMVNTTLELGSGSSDYTGTLNVYTL